MIQEFGDVDETQNAEPSTLTTPPIFATLELVRNVSATTRLQASTFATTRRTDKGEDERALERPADERSPPKVMYLPEDDNELYPIPPSTPGRVTLPGKATVLKIDPSLENASK